MVTKELNIAGNCIGYMEWVVVNEKGEPTDDGEYIYIASSWMNENEKFTDLFFRLALRVYFHPMSQMTKWVYWQKTRDINGRKAADINIASKHVSKAFDKHEFIKRLKQRSSYGWRKSTRGQENIYG